MTPNNRSSPAEGPGAAPEQVPATQPRITGAGGDGRAETTPQAQARWAPSQGPVRTEPGRPGGHAHPPATPTTGDPS